MYRKESEGWFKHADFILLDVFCLELAFYLSAVLGGMGINPYGNLTYRNMAIVLGLADVAAIFILDTMQHVMRRNRSRELLATFQNVALTGLIAVLYLFLVHQGSAFSRKVFILMLLFDFGLSFFTRLLWKERLSRRRADEGSRSLLIVTTSDMAEQTVQNIRSNSYGKLLLSGLVLTDSDRTGSTIAGVPAVAGSADAPMYVCRQWIDEVLVVLPEDAAYPEELMNQLARTGVTMHLNLSKVTEMKDRRQFVESMGPYTVLTTSLNYASPKQLLFKRVMDIAGGLVGCLLTGIIFLFVAPAIYISSPGPIFFSQERIGKNGKKFKIYKFRSMYMDAEARKAELMKDNRISDGRMFKLDFDPRVIGNRLLPDGTRKTGIGNFIRVTSLDEFPQFFNVLKGDMSIVGTRPPLPGEVSEYELHHRARLAIKPGITGMWQVSGRSEITDFEDVVKLDTKYIREWTPMLDIKILLETVKIVLKREGAK